MLKSKKKVVKKQKAQPKQKQKQKQSQNTKVIVNIGQVRYPARYRAPGTLYIGYG
jgi:hypothetical protein